jgi:hypothetical protein
VLVGVHYCLNFGRGIAWLENRKWYTVYNAGSEGTLLIVCTYEYQNQGHNSTLQWPMPFNLHVSQAHKPDEWGIMFIQLCYFCIINFNKGIKSADTRPIVRLVEIETYTCWWASAARLLLIRTGLEGVPSCWSVNRCVTARAHCLLFKCVSTWGFSMVNKSSELYLSRRSCGAVIVWYLSFVWNLSTSWCYN